MYCTVLDVVISDWLVGKQFKKRTFVCFIVYCCFMMSVFEEHTTGLDVSGLGAGVIAVLVCAVIATVLGIYCYKAKNKDGRTPAQ